MFIGREREEQDKEIERPFCSYPSVEKEGGVGREIAGGCTLASCSELAQCDSTDNGIVPIFR